MTEDFLAYVYIYIASNKCMYSADSSSAAVSSSQSKRLSELPLRRSIYRCDLTADSTMIATIAVKYADYNSLLFRVDMIKNHPSSSLPSASVADMPRPSMKLHIAISKREIGFLLGSKPWPSRLMIQWWNLEDGDFLSHLMDFAQHWAPPTGRPDLSVIAAEGIIKQGTSFFENVDDEEQGDKGCWENGDGTGTGWWRWRIEGVIRASNRWPSWIETRVHTGSWLARMGAEEYDKGYGGRWC